MWRMSSYFNYPIWAGIWTTAISYTINSQLIVTRLRKRWFFWDRFCFTNFRGSLDLQCFEKLRAEFQLELGHQGNKCSCWEVGLTYVPYVEFLNLFILPDDKKCLLLFLLLRRCWKSQHTWHNLCCQLRLLLNVPSSQMTLTLNC